MIEFEVSGVHLLKRWDSSKCVDHYAVGISGTFAWRLGSGVASIVQLLPSGIEVGPWTASTGWQTLELAQDPDAALERLDKAVGARFSLLNYNCEHFARSIVCDKQESHQVQVCALVGVAAALLLVSR
jgi:hypothetical protein